MTARNGDLVIGVKKYEGELAGMLLEKMRMLIVIFVFIKVWIS